MPTPYQALSLGGGVQTAALALMLEKGELSTPPPDFAVFADTQAEPPHVYETLDWLEARVTYPIIRASAGNLDTDTWDAAQGKRTWRKVNQLTDLPTHSILEGGGLTKRQCTTHYKVAVIKRAYRAYTGIAPPALSVHQYLGISVDEAHRMRSAPERYISNVYPLIDAGLTRSDCQSYLDREHPGHPVGKSACYFCPFHSKAEWVSLAARYPAIMERAAQLDDLLRDGPRKVSLVKHRGGLRSLYSAAEAQGTFEGFGNECAGVCGV